MNEPKTPTQVSSIRLLADLFAEKARNDELHAKLWETNPKKHGTDAEGIALQKGRAEAWKEASDMIKAHVFP